MTDKPEGSNDQDSVVEATPTDHPDQMPLLIGGIDKELLKETGRASAVQDLSGKVEKFGDIAAAIQQISADAIIVENKRNRRLIRALLIGLVVVICMSAATTYNSFINKTGVDKINTTVSKIDKNQEGIDELVAYLHTLPPPNTGQSQVVTDLEKLICASSDDLDLLAACNDKGISPQPRG